MEIGECPLLQLFTRLHLWCGWTSESGCYEVNIGLGDWCQVYWNMQLIFVDCLQEARTQELKLTQ